MGRVIRHRRDYGAIIMCDERFQTAGARKQLSSWLRGLVQVYPNFGSVSGSLTKFFRVRACTTYCLATCTTCLGTAPVQSLLC